MIGRLIGPQETFAGQHDRIRDCRARLGPRIVGFGAARIYCRIREAETGGRGWHATILHGYGGLQELALESECSKW
ncbi:MAG: hypothetical protein O7G83_09955 [Proteobacteria bacterium]|nr:hypothetical protein [Pseudomonadota bacterium]